MEITHLLHHYRNYMTHEYITHEYVTYEYYNLSCEELQAEKKHLNETCQVNNQLLPEIDGLYPKQKSVGNLDQVNPPTLIIKPFLHLDIRTVLCSLSLIHERSVPNSVHSHRRHQEHNNSPLPAP